MSFQLHAFRFLAVGVYSLAILLAWGAPTGARAQLPPGLNPNQFLLYGGAIRFYDVLVPASYDGSADVPLVVDLHGFGRTKEWQESQSGFAALSEAQGFIAAWPQGLNNTWNAGDPCGNPTVDDVGFLRAMVSAIAAENRIDPRRIYITGQSCGGAMTHRLACEAADLFAAAAPFAWPGPMVPCAPSRPIPVLMTHSFDDANVHYYGGPFELGRRGKRRAVVGACTAGGMATAAFLERA